MFVSLAAFLWRRQLPETDWTLTDLPRLQAVSAEDAGGIAGDERSALQILPLAAAKGEASGSDDREDATLGPDYRNETDA